MITDGVPIHFGLSERFAGTPITVMDSASTSSSGPGASGQVLTDEEEAERAWLEMGRWLGDAWKSPPQGAASRDQGSAAQAQAAWAGSSQLPVAQGRPGSSQVLDDGSPEAAHQQMVSDMESAWKTPSR